MANTPGTAGSQQWRLVRAYGGFYKLVNARSGMCIDVPGWSKQPGQALQQYPCDPSDHNQLNQLWLPIRRDDGSYVLASANTPRISTDSPQMVLDIQGSGDRARLVQAPNSGGEAATQRWRFSVPPGVYTITSDATGKAVEVPDYSSSWGTGLVQRAPTGGANQQWRLTDGPGGTYRIQSLVSGLCMDVTGGSHDPDVAIEQYGCDPNAPNQPNQLWRLEPQDDGSFALVSANTTGMALSVRDRSKADGAALVQTTLDRGEPTQQWRLHRYPEPAAGGGYSITSSLTGKAIDVPTLSVGQPLQQHGFNGTGAQQWRLDDARDGFVRIKNPNTGLCMSASDRDEAGKIVLVGVQDDCATSDLWQVVPEGDGTFALASAAESTSVLTLEGASADDGIRLVMAPDTHARHQRWVFGGRTTTFRLGDARYVTALPPASAGFAVMAVDAAARPVAGTPRSFATSGGNTAGDDANQSDLANTLKTLAGQPGTTVLVQSLGAPKPNRGGWNAIGDAIQSLGGDRPTFLRLDGSGDYALVGCGNCPPGQPTMNEVLRRKVSPNVPKARLDGLLERNGDSTFTAVQAGPGELDSTLADLAYRTTTPWPYTDTANGREALDDIATILNLSSTTTICGPGLGAVRSAYCATNLRKSSWANIVKKLDGIAYPQPTPPYSEAFFKAVKAQLQTEMGWLDLSHGVISDIRDVFTGVSNQFTPFAPTNIAAAIQRDIERPMTQNPSVAGFVFQTILAGLELGAALTEPEGVSFFLTLGETALALAGANDDGSTGASLGAVSAAATDYASQLQKRFGAVVSNLDSIEDVIATDYGKLSVMAANATGNWLGGTQNSKRMNGQLKAGATQELWTKLLPTAYKLFQYPPPPAGFKLQELYCGPTYGPYHYVYLGQPDAANFAPIGGVDGNGWPQRPNAQAMTPIVEEDLTKNVDRVVRQPLLDLLYRPPTFATDDTLQSAGFAPDELPSRVHFDVRPYQDSELGLKYNCYYRHSGGGSAHPFPCSPKVCPRGGGGQPAPPVGSVLTARLIR